MTINVVKLASSLMRCQSVTPNDGGAFELMEQALKVMRFDVKRKVFEQEGHPPVENFYARLGASAPHLCFAGHIDVVPPGDESEWTSPPFEPEERNGVLYGRGAEDMKGAIAAFIVAVTQVFAENKGKIPGSISLMITADEEGEAVNGTKKVLEWLKEEGEVFDACLVGEPTNPKVLGEMIKIGRRGSYLGVLTATGKQGHVAYPELADNPVSRLVDMLYTMQYAPVDKGNKNFPPSNLEVTSIDVGNSTDNMIPAKATARFNIRFNDNFTGETIDQWVRAKCDSIGAEYELQSRVSGEAFLNNDDQLTNMLVASVMEVTRQKPVLSTTGGTSDARFIKDYCPVIEFGTTNMTAHQVNECVKVADLKKLTAVYTDFIRRFMKMIPTEKNAAAMQGTDLGGKGEQGLADAHIAGGKKQNYQDTVIKAGTEDVLEFSDSDLAALSGDFMMGTDLAGKSDEDENVLLLGSTDADVVIDDDALDYWKNLEGGGSASAYSDTELGGGTKQTYMDTEIGGKAAGPDYGFIELGGKSKAEQTYMDTTISGKKKVDEAPAKARIDSGNIGNYRNMIRHHASLMLQMLVRKLVYAALHSGGMTVKDSDFHRKIDQLITARRRRMIDEVKFVGIPEATAFVDKEIEILKKIAMSKVPTLSEELISMKDKLDQFPKAWSK